MVEEIEEVAPEADGMPLSNHKLLPDRKIPILLERPPQQVARRVPIGANRAACQDGGERSIGSIGEAGRIDVLVHPVLYAAAGVDRVNGGAGEDRRSDAAAAKG